MSNPTPTPAALREAVARQLLFILQEDRLYPPGAWEQYDSTTQSLLLQNADRILALLPLDPGEAPAPAPKGEVVSPFSKYAHAPWLQPEPISGITLRALGDHALVEVEIDGVRKLAIRERLDCPFDHYISATGIRGLFGKDDTAVQYAESPQGSVSEANRPNPNRNPTVTQSAAPQGQEESK